MNGSIGEVNYQGCRISKLAGATKHKKFGVLWKLTFITSLMQARMAMGSAYTLESLTSLEPYIVHCWLKSPGSAS